MVVARGMATIVFMALGRIVLGAVLVVRVLVMVVHGYEPVRPPQP